MIFIENVKIIVLTCYLYPCNLLGITHKPISRNGIEKSVCQPSVHIFFLTDLKGGLKLLLCHR